jgi:hypothetical protein
MKLIWYGGSRIEWIRIVLTELERGRGYDVIDMKIGADTPASGVGETTWITKNAHDIGHWILKFRGLQDE